MWTTLNFNSKLIGRDWSVGLGAMLGDDHTEWWKIFFSVSGISSGKADSVILLGFQCTRNPQCFIKFVGAIFEKIKIFKFFLCELRLILRVGRKQKIIAIDICKMSIYIEFERD